MKGNSLNSPASVQSHNTTVSSTTPTSTPHGNTHHLQQQPLSVLSSSSHKQQSLAATSISPLRGVGLPDYHRHHHASAHLPHAPPPPQSHSHHNKSLSPFLSMQQHYTGIPLGRGNVDNIGAEEAKTEMLSQKLSQPKKSSDIIGTKLKIITDKSETDLKRDNPKQQSQKPHLSPQSKPDNKSHQTPPRKLITMDPINIRKFCRPYSRQELVQLMCGLSDGYDEVYVSLVRQFQLEHKWCKIFVHGLPWCTTEPTLLQVFKRFGRIRECVILKKNNGQSKGFGFITFATAKEAMRAIGAGPQWIDGRTVATDLAWRGRRDRSGSDAYYRSQYYQKHFDAPDIPAFTTREAPTVTFYQPTADAGEMVAGGMMDKMQPGSGGSSGLGGITPMGDMSTASQQSPQQQQSAAAQAAAAAQQQLLQLTQQPWQPVMDPNDPFWDQFQQSSKTEIITYIKQLHGIIHQLQRAAIVAASAANNAAAGNAPSAPKQPSISSLSSSSSSQSSSLQRTSWKITEEPQTPSDGVS